MDRKDGISTQPAMFSTFVWKSTCCLRLKVAHLEAVSNVMQKFASKRSSLLGEKTGVSKTRGELLGL